MDLGLPGLLSRGRGDASTCLTAPGRRGCATVTSLTELRYAAARPGGAPLAAALASRALSSPSHPGSRGVKTA